MQNETHYYLLNGTVKKGGQMPKLDTKKLAWNIYKHNYDIKFNQWLSSLQPCEIDESELDKIDLCISENSTIYIDDNNPIDITDIVEEKDCKIYFKQHTEKQVESECDAVEFLNWVLSSGYKLNPHSKENKWRHYEQIESVKPILDDGITTKQLYEIFKNR